VSDQFTNSGGSREATDGEPTFDLASRLAGMGRSGPPTRPIFGQRPAAPPQLQSATPEPPTRPVTEPAASAEAAVPAADTAPEPMSSAEPSAAPALAAVPDGDPVETPQPPVPPTTTAPASGSSAGRVGRMTRVPATDVWPTRAALAAWIIEDPSVLADAIGTAIIEAADGGAPNRVLATAADGSALSVVCELTETTDEGLGAVLGVAALGASSTVVWVAGSAQPTHRASLSWLNRREDARFFLATVEGVRIGDSAAAALMETAVRPPRSEAPDNGASDSAPAEGRRAEDHHEG
jgi:hypothetical protein